MGYSLIITNKAESDVDEATAYYFNIRKNLAKKFITELKTTVKYIQKNPDKIQIRYGNIRIAFLKAFPFGIHYTVASGTIIILAVFHTARDNEKWTQ